MQPSGRPIEVDCDNIEQVMTNLNVRLKAGETEIRFREFEDFEPERIQALLPKDMPEPAYKPARRLRDELPVRAPNLSASILDLAADATETGNTANDPLQKYVNRIVEPHLAEKADPRVLEAQAKVEAEASAISQQQAFVRVETAWRLLDFLAREVETTTLLKIYMMDVPKAHLPLTNIKGDWALILGNYSFGGSADDLELLARMSLKAAETQAPFLAEANLAILDKMELWEEIKKFPEAAWVGLALPRFEVHHKLYGNAAFLCGVLLARTFTKNGWKMRPGEFYRFDGKTSETLMTQSQAEQLIELGLIPVIGWRDQERLQVGMFQSITGKALNGRWKQ